MGAATCVRCRSRGVGSMRGRCLFDHFATFDHHGYLLKDCYIL